MITAAEARALQETGQANVNKFLDLIELEIKKTAAGGYNRYVCYVEGLWSTTDRRRPPPLTGIQQAVIDALKQSPYSFGATWAADGDSYVPRGLADDDGHGPAYQNWCIHISW